MGDDDTMNEPWRTIYLWGTGPAFFVVLVWAVWVNPPLDNEDRFGVGMVSVLGMVCWPAVLVCLIIYWVLIGMVSVVDRALDKISG